MLHRVKVDRERDTRKLFRQSSHVFLAQMVSLVAGILSTFLVARLGGPEGKGFIYTLQFLAGIAVILVNFGIGPAAVYHFRRDVGFDVRDITAGLLWPSVLLGCVPLVLLAALRQTPIALFHTGVWDAAAMLAFAAVPAYTLVWNLSYLYLAKGEIAGYNLLRSSQSAIFAAILVVLLVAHVTQLRVLVGTWIASVWLPALLAL